MRGHELSHGLPSQIVLAAYHRHTRSLADTLTQDRADSECYPRNNRCRKANSVLAESIA
jgi:hypothetical protein